MEINEVKRITDLLKRANCTNFALVSETAKEMGVKKTALMQFIEDNPKLFRLGEAFKSTKTTKTSLGLSIITAYLTPEENPDTEEWIEKMKKEWEKKIHVGEQTYYGYHEFWCIFEDNPKSDSDTYRKMGLYRNTPEKMKFLVDAGVIEKTERCYGGFGDCRRGEFYLYDSEVEKKLNAIGWTTDFSEHQEKKEEK